MIHRCKYALLLLAMLSLPFVFAAGCSHNNSNDNIVSYGKIKVHYENLPDDVETVYFSLFTPAGTCIWGPKQANIAEHPDYVSLYQVPVRCTSLCMACYDSEAKRVKYFYSTPVTVTAGETQDIENPELQDVDNVSLLSYKVENDLRAHTGDTVGFQVMAVMGTADDHYYQDLSEYATWSVDKDNRLATTDAQGNAIKSKGTYRCLDTVDSEVKVSAAFGVYADSANVDITNASIAKAEFYSDITEVLPADLSGKISGTLPLPTGADIVPVMFVAEWSDGETSLLNTSASWENNDYTGYIAANRGRLVGIGNKPDREEKIESVQVIAKYVSNGKEYSDTVDVTVVDADLSGLALTSESVEIDAGSDIPVFVMGVYGAQGIKVLQPSFAYKWSSDDEAVVKVTGTDKPLAEAAGFAKLTATSTVKNTYKASCDVTVTSDDESADETESESADETESGSADETESGSADETESGSADETESGSADETESGSADETESGSTDETESEG